ncbi:MAG: hypothetical protein ACREBR_03840 [bacterium]
MKYLLKFVFDHKTVPVCLRRWHANQFGPMEEGSLDVRPKNNEWGALKSSFRKAEFERRFRAVTLVASRQSYPDMLRLFFRHGVCNFFQRWVQSF